MSLRSCGFIVLQRFSQLSTDFEEFPLEIPWFGLICGSVSTRLGWAADWP